MQKIKMQRKNQRVELILYGEKTDTSCINRHISGEIKKNVATCFD
jgi:hypothetical protein